MVDILHRIAVKDIAPARVSDTVATGEGIASWWLGGTKADGDTLVFADGLEAKVVEREPEHVRWEFTAGPQEWLGTHADFAIKPEDDYTVVLFKHEGWSEAEEFMHHCSTKWAVFLLSLKQLLETGTGRPTPNDVHIDNWS